MLRGGVGSASESGNPGVVSERSEGHGLEGLPAGIRGRGTWGPGSARLGPGGGAAGGGGAGRAPAVERRDGVGPVAEDALAELFEARVGAGRELARLAGLAALGPHGNLAARGHHERGGDVRPVGGQEGQVSARLQRQLGAPAAVLVVGVALVVEPGAGARPVRLLEVRGRRAGRPDAGDGRQGQSQQQGAQRGHGDTAGPRPRALLCA